MARRRANAREKSLYRRIGDRILAARVKAKMTRQELATAASLHASMINYVEAGRGGSLPTLYTLARVLKMKLADLLPEVPS